MTTGSFPKALSCVAMQCHGRCYALTPVETVNDSSLQEDAGILENIALLLDILQGVKDLVDRREKGVNKEHQQAFNRVSPNLYSYKQ